MAVENMISNFMNSVLGNPNKAYILLRKKLIDTGKLENETDAGLKKELVKGNPSGMAYIAAKLKTQTYANRTKQNGYQSINDVLDIADPVKNGKNSGDFFPLQLQFNPRSIQFSGSQGHLHRSGIGAENQSMSMDVPVETVMSVELEFDSTNIMDAFTFEKLNVLTVGGAVNTMREIKTNKKYSGYSVQDISEVFVGAMIRPSTRWVAFIWNKMVFWGELTSVNVRYTMFNPYGNPIRSKVSLRIRQDSSETESDYASEKNWEKAFKQMFQTKYVTNEGRVVNEHIQFL